MQVIHVMRETTIGMGSAVYDTEQGQADGEAYVVGVTTHKASEYHIDAIDKTVAECNPSYPSDDRVIEIVFKDALSSQTRGLLEKDASLKASQGRDFGEVFASGLRAHDDTTVYTYPESRLEAV